MIIVTGTVRVDPARSEAAREIMERMITASRAEDGCIEYAYAHDLLEPGLVRVNEAWRDRAALSAHFQTPHMAAWRGVFPSLGITDRNLALYEAGQPEPI